MTATITLDQLIKADACERQRDLFRATLGDSVEVTVALAVAHADKFDWGWAAYHLLSPAARADYERAEAAAWADYERAEAAAFAEAYINEENRK